MVKAIDVAKRAGVSISTVSKVLNGNGTELISPSCAVRVRKAAEELGYRPNYLARSLSKGRIKSAGIIFRPPRAAEATIPPFYYALTAGMDGEIRMQGWDTVIIGPDKDAEAGHAVEVAIDQARQGRVDCLLMSDYLYEEIDPGMVSQSPVPIVLVDVQGPRPLPSVMLDDAVGIRAAISHLANLGHKRICWVTYATYPHSSAQRRQTAFHEAIVTQGCIGIDVVMPPFHPGRGTAAEISAARSGCLADMATIRSCTAAVCYDELVAIGLYAALQEFGLRVPRDLSIVGFDDVYAETTYPSMTVVSHQLLELGKASARLGMELVSHPVAGDVPAPLVTIPSSLVIRTSTAPVTDRKTTERGVA